MGNKFTSSNSDKKKVKMTSTKVVDFSGADEDWHKWKNKTLCAFSGTGYSEVLKDREHADNNPEDNEIVFSQISSATTDGIAYHLVQKFEDARDGHAAWESLCDWYDGESVQNETAENLRVKLENLVLHPGFSAALYVNKFSAWYRDLEKIPGESYSKSHVVFLFLKNITDPDYATTVEIARGNKTITLDDCITRIRKKERELIQKRVERKRLKSVVRRMKHEPGDSDDDDDDSDAPTPKRRKTGKARRVQEKGKTSDKPSDNQKFEGELATTERGLLRFKSDCWKKMNEKDQEWVREYNAAVKHGEIDKVKIPTGISIKRRIRRTQMEEVPMKDDEEGGKRKKPSNDKRKKGVTFGISDDLHTNDDDE